MQWSEVDEQAAVLVRGWVRQASKQCGRGRRTGVQGVSVGYRGIGYALAEALPGLCPDVEMLEELVALLGTPDQCRPWGRSKEEDDAVLAWFDQHLPICMALVPSVRRGMFLAGVYLAARDGKLAGGK